MVEDHNRSFGEGLGEGLMDIIFLGLAVEVASYLPYYSLQERGCAVLESWRLCKVRQARGPFFQPRESKQPS